MFMREQELCDRGWCPYIQYQSEVLCQYHTDTYRIAGIFQGGGGGVKNVWFSWLGSEPQNIYPQMINSDLVPRPPATNHAH